MPPIEPMAVVEQVAELASGFVHIQQSQVRRAPQYWCSFLRGRTGWYVISGAPTALSYGPSLRQCREGKDCPRGPACATPPRTASSFPARCWRSSLRAVASRGPARKAFATGIAALRLAERRLSPSPSPARLALSRNAPVLRSNANSSW